MIRHGKNSATALAGCLAICLLSSLAQADPGDASPAGETEPWKVGVSVSARQEATKHFMRGNELFKDLRFPEAITAYKQALRHWNHPRIHYHIMLAAIAIKDYLLAYHSSVQALRYGPDALGEKQYRNAEEKRRRLEKERLARIEVTCDVPGSVVTLDGKRLFIAPGRGERLVLPGKHEILATRRGYIADSLSLELRSGEKRVQGLQPRSMEETTRWPAWQPWVIGGAGVAALAAGTIAVLQSKQADQEAQDLFDRLYPNGIPHDDVSTEVRDLEKKARRYLIGGVASFVVSAGIISVATYMFRLNRPSTERLEQKSGVAVSPWTTDRGAGVSATFRF